ncbi:MAG: T9SS type A sorting domain-containing protein, partial [candidate division WOR-3 bacterium]
NITNTTQASFEYGKLTTKDANPYDGDTEVFLPYGILQKSDTLTIKQILSSDFAVEYIIEPKKYNLQTPVSLRLLYFDLNDDGKEDILGIEEKNLAIYYYDEFKNKYVYIGGKVDTKQNIISAEVYNLGRFVITSKNAQAVINNLDNSVTSKFFITPANPLIKFSEDVQEVVIYTISGKEIYRKKSTNGENIIWLGKDSLGNFVESGIYICKIKNRNSNKYEYKYVIVGK